MRREVGFDYHPISIAAADALSVFQVPTFAELNASTTPDGLSNPVMDALAPLDSD
jgi:hypothetical protein